MLGHAMQLEQHYSYQGWYAVALFTLPSAWLARHAGTIHCCPSLIQSFALSTAAAAGAAFAYPATTSNFPLATVARPRDEQAASPGGDDALLAVTRTATAWAPVLGDYLTRR